MTPSRSSGDSHEGLLLGLGRLDLGAEQALQVSPLFEEQDNLFEVAREFPFYRQHIVQFLLPRTASASLRLVAEADAVRDT